MITFEHVSKSYRTSTRPALKDVSLHIDEGEFVFLIGPSGSGKSTFLQLMLGEVTADEGALEVAGFDLRTLKGKNIPKLRQRIGYVFQDFRLLPKKNVYDNVAFALEVIGKKRSEIQETVPDVLKTVGLDGKERRFPNELSGGEQQRVAIARAYVNEPKILLADEPTGNLDPETSTEIMLLLNRINQTGTTVIMSTHDNVAVDSMRKRVVELSNGKLIRDDARGVYGVGR
ncbi:cell division ATP-binding protein FtsE [Corynebacterium sp. 320]|uniref:Cell division ATP-binding protein FtsE n=1 Tax=Corynebacterium zhongnanshanii TaxID=2768834 RepID=A0ABQ6VDN8_9CORY|nr:MULTISPECIES: cell division ATP-binding protein FtsE [Corynebacterium]KAB1501404.1 cell division ATP-binding protein FtsE [Corynebacterium sp. 320]KAB1551471.1 cell division ATP-binding protein FtsE [Corynebacterium sp. 321]KAB1551701.1 cell division ATP-binding protein FtsE [Corynebacterium sp. 319]KAB3521014.1 cell division ATP-binding protein FtsE [Corynebacterium zhongnanshanii]KAB3525762.1 cell division ATP-binding protein FtsE [Corynebacterium sp. 250]